VAVAIAQPVVFSDASKFGVRTIVPLNRHLHTAISRSIERAPEIVETVLRSGVTVMFHGTIYLVALPPLYSA
jgi:hypothetical protein